jgi:sialate O-acetylesterase
MNHGGPDIDTGVYPFYKSPDNEEDLPRVRHRRFGWGASLEPQPDVQEMFREPESRWGVKEDYPEGSSTSMAQYFARIVRDELEVPVGIIHVAVSGINQVAWLSKETLETFSGKGGNYYEEFLAEREAALAKGGEIRSWDDFLKVETDWSADKKGNWPGRGMTYVSFPTALYNTRIVPLAPYAIRGVIWHQGEAGPGGPHAERMVAKVQQWRELFGQDFAFIWGTLSKLGSDEPPLLPAKSGFYRSSTNAQLRKALELFGDDPLTEYVELYDLGNQDTHFSLKAEGGRRMGLAAMAKIYGKPGIYTGPRLVESSFRGDTATLKFSQVGDGLNYEPTINGISGFYVFDGKTPAWGEVKLIDKTTVEVSYPGGGSLEYVGYGTANNPHETLFNTDQIPASPFAAKDGDVKTVNAEQTYSLLEPQEKMGGAKFHVAHVRKDGYIFEIRPGRGKALETVSMLAYVSPEWSGVAVEAEGESLQVEEITEDGQKFVKFDAPTGSQRIIVADPGKIESFRGVDRF